MHEEIEVKFLNVDPDKLQEKLAAIGAKKVGEFFYRRRVFDYPDWRLDKTGAWLRLRDEGGRVTLTFKKRLGMSAHDVSANDKGMQEIEVEVSDFDRTVNQKSSFL
ncbi:MAG: CYTH domain-containing protein [bacterium]|nr:CYTH domain-containing protein [bacterium]